MFARGPGGPLILRVGEEGRRRHQPGRQPQRQLHIIVQRQHQRALFRRRHMAGISHDHDRRLQALGAVHRHQPHGIDGGFGIALHLQILGRHPGDEGLQAGRARGFAGQRLIKHGVDGIAGFLAQPRQQLAAAGQQPGEDGFEEAIRRYVRRQPQHLGQHGARGGNDGIVTGQHGGPQGARPCCRQPGELIMIKAAEGRDQQRRQREIIIGLAGELHQRQQIGHGQRFGQIEPVGAGHRHAGFVQRRHQRVH